MGFKFQKEFFLKCFRIFLIYTCIIIISFILSAIFDESFTLFRYVFIFLLIPSLIPLLIGIIIALIVWNLDIFRDYFIPSILSYLLFDFILFKKLFLEERKIKLWHLIIGTLTLLIIILGPFAFFFAYIASQMH